MPTRGIYGAGPGLRAGPKMLGGRGGRGSPRSAPSGGGYGGDAGAPAPSSGPTWNPVDKGVDCVLTGGNLIASEGGGQTGNVNVRATTGHSATGKFYLEMVSTKNGFGPSVGLCDINLATNNSWDTSGNFWSIQISTGYTFEKGGVKVSGVTWASGDNVGIAVDFAAGKIWFAQNGVWILSGDPGAGTNPCWSAIAGTLYPGCRPYATGGSVTAKFNAGSWSYSAPSGFGAW